LVGLVCLVGPVVGLCWWGLVGGRAVWVGASGVGVPGTDRGWSGSRSRSTILRGSGQWPGGWEWANGVVPAGTRGGGGGAGSRGGLLWATEVGRRGDAGGRGRCGGRARESPGRFVLGWPGSRGPANRVWPGRGPAARGGGRERRARSGGAAEQGPRKTRTRDRAAAVGPGAGGDLTKAVAGFSARGGAGRGGPRPEIGFHKLPGE